MMPSVPQTDRIARVATKVPEITASFWVIKVLTCSPARPARSETDLLAGTRTDGQRAPR
jgi:uncharacterized membrane-anchored protein